MYVTLCFQAGCYFIGDNLMLQAQLYFLSDQYYQDFPDEKLMKNRDIIDGIPHNRPCFFAFVDSKITDIYWIVPISSRYEKFKRIEQDKCSKSTVGLNNSYKMYNSESGYIIKKIVEYFTLRFFALTA